MFEQHTVERADGRWWVIHVKSGDICADFETWTEARDHADWLNIEAAERAAKRVA